MSELYIRCGRSVRCGRRGGPRGAKTDSVDEDVGAVSSDGRVDYSPTITKATISLLYSVS